jgi:D-alanyl-D-alanine dipeptidase
LRTIWGALGNIRGWPIPDQTRAILYKRGFRNHPIAVRTPEEAEPLVDARKFGLAGENWYASQRNPPHYAPVPGSIAGLFLRRGVAERLAAVDARLAPIGLRVWVFDGWRPDAVQTWFHDQWVPEQIRARKPGLLPSAVLDEVETYWSAPTVDPAHPAPHRTGGAVDLTLVWADTGEQLWMGSLFDELSPLARLDHFEVQKSEGLTISDDEARANRRFLYHLMCKAGFAANPHEWWHYGYGDQMWARLTGAAAAVYGAVQLEGDG